MRPAKPLPDHLHGRAIAVAAAADVGLSPARLRDRAIDRPFCGVRSFGVDMSSVIGRASAYLPRLRPAEVFSHSTAAMLFGIPLPSALERETVIHVTSTDVTRPRAVGVVGHRIRDLPRRRIASMPVAAPADVWCQLATQLELADLIAAADALISGERLRGGYRTQPWCSVRDLREAVDRHRPARGTAKLDAALPCVRAGVDSRRETLLRLLIIERGFPEPEVGGGVDVGDGTLLHPDLSYPDHKVAIEYEGDEHRTDRRRWADDISRVRALEAAGWRVLRVTAADLVAPAGFLSALRAALG